MGNLGIKVRADGERRSRWLARGGSETTKRLHALMFDEERAAAVVAQLTRDNPGYTFTAAPLMEG